MKLDWHFFSTAHEIKKYRNLGQELDYQLSAKLTKDISLAAGYSVMLAARTMEDVKGGNRHSWQDWGWLSLNINPRIFSKKW